MIANGEIVNTFFGQSDDFGYCMDITYIFNGFGGHYTLFLNQQEKIVELFKILEVKNFNDIKGKYIRIEYEGLRPLKMGHIIKDKWIDL